MESAVSTLTASEKRAAKNELKRQKLKCEMSPDKSIEEDSDLEASKSVEDGSWNDNYEDGDDSQEGDFYSKKNKYGKKAHQKRSEASKTTSLFGTLRTSRYQVPHGAP